MLATVVHLLINFYIGYLVRVQWRGVVSKYFLAINGVKQGGVLSPVLFCLCIDCQLIALTKAGVGCLLGKNEVGTLAYADSIVLLARTASALCIMLAICDEYANDFSILFNVSKSQCVAFLHGHRRYLSKHTRKCTFYVDINPVEFVNSFSISDM